MSANYQGRGAWNKNGVGGTVTQVKGADKPGPYYMLTKDPNLRPGFVGFLKHYANVPVDLNEDAVYHGVIGIQILLAGLGIPCPVSGVFDVATKVAVVEAQTRFHLTPPDGIAGPTTMKHLILPLIQRKSGENNIDWKPVYGILANEGGFDPGAVGLADSDDLGLAQINIRSHPGVALADTFCPSFAIKFVIGLLQQGLNAFHNMDQAIASYNLGVGGTRQWISAGSPDEWTPQGTTEPRNVRKYIDRILKAADNI